MTKPVISPPCFQHAAFHYRKRGDSCQNSPHCHLIENSRQRAPILSYNHFDLLFTPLCISSLLFDKNKRAPGKCSYRWLWWDWCPGKPSKMCRVKKGRLSDDAWTLSCCPWQISPGFLQFRHLQLCRANQLSEQSIPLAILQVHVHWEYL